MSRFNKQQVNDMTPLQTLCKMAATANIDQLNAAIDALKGNRPLLEATNGKPKSRFASVLDQHPTLMMDRELSGMVQKWIKHVGVRMSVEKLRLDLDALDQMGAAEIVSVITRAISNGWYTLGCTNGIPGWRRKVLEESALKNHPGNPNSACYDRDACTVAMREDYSRRLEALGEQA